MKTSECKCPPTLQEVYAEIFKRKSERVKKGEHITLLWPYPSSN